MTATLPERANIPAEQPPVRLHDPRRDGDIALPPNIRTNRLGVAIPTPAPGDPPMHYPLGRNGLPLVGVAFEFQRNPLKLISDSYRRYGPIFTTTYMGTPLTWFIGPEANKMILSSNASNFLWRPALGRLVCLLGEGLIVSDGAFHKQQRSLVMPAFHKQRIESYLNDIITVSDQVMDTWQVGSEIDVDAEMRRITLLVIARALFGIDLEQGQSELRKQFNTTISYLELTPPFNMIRLDLPGSPWAKFIRARAELDRFIFNLMAERRANPGDRGDVLDALMVARDEDGNALTDEQIRDQCLTLLAAGHDTTANTLTWMQHLLDKNPRVLAKLVEENRRVLGNRKPEMADLKLMPYLEMAIKETLRLYPAAWSGARLSAGSFSFGGYNFAAGTLVAFSQYMSHRIPEIFHDPDEFKPERFDPASGEKHPPFAFIPFGGGPRLCIGAAFAMMEAQVIMARLLQRYRLSVRPGYRVKPRIVVTMSVHGGLPVTVHSA